MKNVILCGLGAIGITFATKLRKKCNLKILVDQNRLVRYRKKKPIFNGEEQEYDYLLPSENFETDLIIVTTKSNGLNSVIENIKNFVAPNTIIISLINGISSEEKISKFYPNAKVLKSYFIGHSAVREGNSVKQDGVGEIVIEHNQRIENFFNEVGINYSIVEDIDYALWLKFIFNVFSNQTSAILNMNFGELRRNKSFIDFAKKIIAEVQQIAKLKGIKNTEKLEEDALKSLEKMCPEGKTSMLQDILAKRPTEVEIFAGEVIRLGEELGVQTPYNKVLYDLIKIKEEDNEYSIHTS